MKKINRNAFNEKLIHRYLFDRYYFADRQKRNLLLPEKYHKLDINLVVPEENRSGEKYRADLSIYFKNRSSEVPAEVKWSISDFTKPSQIEYLKRYEGFVVSFGDIKTVVHSEIDHVIIDPYDFQSWISENISKLTRETLTYQAKVMENSSGNQFWLVFLRGTAHANFEKMIHESPNNTFWAFKQNPHALKNIFNMQKGDYCLYLLAIDKEGQNISDKKDITFEITAWYETRVKEPYYMILHGEKGTFFESGNIPINERRWPHFIDFKIIDKFEPKEKVSFGERGEFARAFKESNNNGDGTPAPLFRGEWDMLIDKLHMIKEKL